MAKFADSFFKNFCDENILEQSALSALKDAAKNSERVAVALSGGSDSVFLLCLAVQICGAKNIVALHFNHKVRKNSDIDESFVKDLCGKFGVEIVIKKRCKAIKKISESELRNLRTDFFESAAKKADVKKILQGHIKSDVAETVLMRLMRGSSLDGLCAPRPISKKHGLIFIRPLLTLNKCDTQKILRQKNIAWREDESNAQSEFLRNKLRNIIIPQILKIENVDFFNACLRSRMLLQEDADFLEKIFRGAILEESDKKIAIAPDKVCEISILRRALQKILSLNKIELRAKAVDEFLKKCQTAKRAKLSAKDFDIAFEANAFCVQEKSKKAFAKTPLKIGKNILPNGCVLKIDRIKISKKEYEKIAGGFYDESICAHIKDCDKLCAKAYAPKIAYTPIGAKSARLVKDMMSAKKTPILKRKSLPIVYCKSDAVWVPTLAPSNNYKIAPESIALRLTYLE